MTTYKIVRTYSKLDGRFEWSKRTIQTGLTFAEAKVHCSDPSTSSHRRPDPRKGNKAWFDGFEEE